MPAPYGVAGALYGIGSAAKAAAPYIGAGLSSIAGTLFGGDGNTTEQQAILGKYFAERQLQWRVDDAKKAGVHPLYAIGAPSVSAPPVGITPGQSRVGVNVAKALGHVLDGNKRKMESLLIKEQQLKNRLLEIDLNKQTQSPAAGSVKVDDPSQVVADHPPGSPGFKLIYPEVERSQSTGVTAGTHAMEDRYVDKDGYLIPLAAKRASEPLENETIEWLKRQYLSAENWIGTAAGMAHWSSKAARRVMNDLKMKQPRHRNKNMRFVWDLRRGNWKEISKRSGKTLFYQGWAERRYRRHVPRMLLPSH